MPTIILFVASKGPHCDMYSGFRLDSEGCHRLGIPDLTPHKWYRIGPLELFTFRPCGPEYKGTSLKYIKPDDLSPRCHGILIKREWARVMLPVGLTEVFSMLFVAVVGSGSNKPQ